MTSASWVTVVWDEFMSEMAEHSTSARGMNWDCETGDIWIGDKSPETQTQTHSRVRQVALAVIHSLKFTWSP